MQEKRSILQIFEWMDNNVREVILYAIMYQNKSHMEKILNIKQSLF